MRADARPARRRGYAVMLASVFIVIMLSLWSVAYRQSAAALRVEVNRSLRLRRDEGPTQAVARALALLETGWTPEDSPSSYGIGVVTQGGERSYTITFTDLGGGLWSVSAAPTPVGLSPTPLP